MIKYLKEILNKKIMKESYIIILDTLLNNSDIFVYKYVFDNVGVLNYKIINDLDLIKDHLTENNVIIMNWSSSVNYAYKINGDVLVYPFNAKIIDRLKRDYIILCGDTPISNNINTPVCNFEYDNYIFNFL